MGRTGRVQGRLSTAVAAATSAQDDIGIGVLRMTALRGDSEWQRFEPEESAGVRARRVQWRHDEIG
jgi:hypothetical protein